MSWYRTELLVQDSIAPHAPTNPATASAEREKRELETLFPVQSATLQASVPLVLTVHEAAGLLRLDPRTIRAMVRAGELEGNHRGHAIRVSGASVLEWLRGSVASRARRGSR